MKSSLGVAAATVLALVTASGCSTMQKWWPFGHRQEESASPSAAMAAPSPAPMAEAATAPVEPASAPAATYTCDNGVKLSVTFDAASASVSIDGAPAVQLQKMPADQESFYSNGRFTLTAKSGEALWGVGRAMPVHCAST